MRRPDIVQARAAAKETLGATRTVTPPVPIERLARQRGMKVQFSPLDPELSGMAYVKEGVPFIGVNSLHHPNRQRFTIAHEMGHHILHAGLLASGVHVDTVVLRRDPLAGQGINPEEIEANNYAAELLMPEEWLAPLVVGLDVGDDEGLAIVAKKFKVSVAALQFRLLKM